MKNSKNFKLVKKGAFVGYYIAPTDFTPECFELETFGDVEYYKDNVIFTGNIREIVLFFVEMEEDNLKKGWGVTNLSTEDLKWINKEALSLVCQYKYLIKEISKC